MTVLEELIDIALKACEKGRIAGQKHHARGAALLGPDGKVHAGLARLVGFSLGQ